MGMTSDTERRKSFSFAYFSRPISKTESVWYLNENYPKKSSAFSGDYSDISAIEITPQDDLVFVTPPGSLTSSLDDVQMECDVDPDPDESFDDDIVFPSKLTALKCDSIAPPEKEWFHGYLGRSEAEVLLSKDCPGSYIVRISADSPDKYVLSVKTLSGCNHFKIKTILGEYYISIYKFPTLGSIIGYFSQVSPLLSGLYLKSPLSPKQAVSREKKLKAKASYTPHPGNDGPDVLSFKQGEIFLTDDVLDGDDCRWIRGRKEKSGETGLIMRVLVQEVPLDEDFYKYEWFHGRITDAMVVDMLCHEAEGRYVITNSGSNSYCMHVKTGNDIKSTHIFPTSDGRYLMGSQSHESLIQCIDSKGKALNANLSPVKRKSVRSVIYGSNVSDRPYIRDDRIQARWRTSNGKDWKSIKIDFDSDENAIFMNTDKKGEKVEKVIPLKECRVYEVDKSVLNVSNCLQVVVTGMNREVQSHFLEVSTLTKYQELLSKLQNEPIDTGPKPPGKRMKSLRIKVCQIDGPTPLNLPGPVFCQVGFDDSTVQRTPDAHSPKKLCWNSTIHCKHNNITQSSELKVKLCYSKNKKACELEAGSVPLRDLNNMTFTTLYSPVNIKGQSNQAKLKLELYYRDHPVLQPSYYHNLLGELQHNNFSCLKLLRDIHWNTDSRETFANVLLTIYDKSKVHLIKELISADVARHPDNDKGSLFRDNTLTTALIVALLNSPSSVSYWNSVFSSIVADMNIRVKARADHTSSDEDKLKELVVEDKNRVLDALIRSVADIPLQIRSVVQHMVAEIEGRWPNDPSSKSAVILTIMFVRFYFLRLSHPHDRDLLVMHQDTPQALLNVAKSIKRKDVSGYLDAISSFPSSPQTDDMCTVENVTTVEAGDGAHLFHLISSTLRNTGDMTSYHASTHSQPATYHAGSCPEPATYHATLDSLKQILQQIHSAEQEVD